MLKTIATYFFILFASILATCVLIESLLRYTAWLDQLNNPQPSYIPAYLYEQYQEVDKDGYVDLFGFRTTFATNNLIETLKQTDGCRVVVLGDSFVWGSGLSVQQSWPSQLQKLTPCTVFPFGKPGWSSYQYLNLYQTHLRELEFDYLIIGIVANDPHPLGKLDTLNFSPELYQRHSVKLINHNGQRQYLDSLTFDDYINSVLGGFAESSKSSQGSMDRPPIISWGYYNWRKRLYESDVYTAWENALVKTVESAKHPTCLLLTPTSNSADEIAIFDQIETTLANHGLNYLNMMPKLDALFESSIRPRDAWANPADGHPGTKQTALYAKGASELLLACD
ncbi:SGNH/GDSL hydrolase family protein [Arenicella xantha]|uniref:GDSL-like lipase/acylhydrolase family protein n=1 Tax=Arenicella xantha TaxID=644221 RepID=A0A395JN76_9GAMM|nr:hypothetical protein [Arenicella xantha]RBP51058.1 hypothetical protein DFR28_102477 [Arenicella xantha]